MRKLGLCTITPKHNTSKPHPAHNLYPYLLRDKTIDQPNQLWVSDISVPRQAAREMSDGPIGANPYLTPAQK
jgi:hypothetical protein